MTNLKFINKIFLLFSFTGFILALYYLYYSNNYRISENIYRIVITIGIIILLEFIILVYSIIFIFNKNKILSYICLTNVIISFTTIFLLSLDYIFLVF